MKINNLKINGFGKLENNSINLDDNINIIYGKNEAGKTSLLKFIAGMFYGVSKNKNGKDISDYDKYNPWNASEFSGKIKYTLDNGDEYEVFRDFSKKAPKIYNDKLEDISNEFTIDKSKQNQFFVEQTLVDEELFFNTLGVEQKQIELDESGKRNVVQKLTNLVSSGDDNTSFKKSIDKLNKKLLDEVGNARTVGRPINIVEEKIEELESQKKELNYDKETIYRIDKQIQEKQQDLRENELDLEIISDIKNLKQSFVIDEEKIKIKEEMISEQKEKEEDIAKQLKQNTVEKRKINPILILLAGVIIVLAASFLLKSFVLKLIIDILIAALLIIHPIVYLKDIKKNNKEKNEQLGIKKQIELLKINQEEVKSETDILRKNLSNKREEEKQKLIAKYSKEYLINELDNKQGNELEIEITRCREAINEIRLEINSLTIEKNNILSKAEKIIQIDEKLDGLLEQKEEIVNLSNIINLAKEELEHAYENMKNNVTPKLTKHLGELIEKATNGKYKNVQFSDENGLTVELENGEYVNCSRLSIGTIEQMYLDLRLSILKQISKETMPIILDEPFAYSDDNRLANILEYISKNYTENQVIIFTCTDREKQALESLGIQYNLVELM